MGSVTINTNTFNVYSQTANALTDATNYLSGKIGNASWESAGTEKQKQAMVSATRWIQRSLAALLGDEASIPDASTTPANQLLSEATYEAAFSLVVDEAQISSQDQRDNKKRLKAGSVEIEFFRPESGAILPAEANALLIRYLNTLGSVTAFGALASGTDGVSEFTDRDRYGRCQGFP